MTRRLQALLLKDDKPGHYHLAEGVLAALARKAAVSTMTIELRAGTRLLQRVLTPAFAAGWATPAAVLRAGYGLSIAGLPRADVVVSAGGETLLANAAAARALGAANIYCGTLRKLPPEAFSLIISSYESHRDRPRHLVTLKPNKLDPDQLGRPDRPPLGAGEQPRRAGLLIGGDSGFFRYRSDEWERLFAFAREVTAAWGTRWLLSTSRRTPPVAEAAAARLAADPSIVEDYVAYRTAGPGSLARIFAKADFILCTEDSSTMISEAVSVRLPVVGVAPVEHAFKPDEAQYRRLLLTQGWTRYVPLAEVDVARLDKALAEISPMRENHIDRLAADLARHLPALFAA